MSWFRRMLGQGTAPTRNPADPHDDFWYSPAGAIAAATSGVLVTEERALQVPVVLDCLTVLSGPLASLPLGIFRRGDDDSREPANDHPLATLLALRPNAGQTAWEFRGQMQWWLAWYRNAYAEILPGDSGPVGHLVPHHPTLVTPYKAGVEIWYRVREEGTGRVRDVHSSSMWHLKALPFRRDGLAGQSVIETSRDTIGAAIAVHEYGQRFFANDGQAGGILEHPNKFADNDSRTNFLAAWRRAGTGANAHRDRVLEHGIKYNRTSLDNQKSQFLETRRENNLDVTRIWRIPPHKVGILERSTNNNIEHQGLEWVTDGLLPWLELWEQKINSELILQPGYFAEFNVAGLLRGDLKSRYEAFAQGRNGGWLSVNDIRRMENMNPVKGGDTYLQPLNTVPLGTPSAPPAAPRAVLAGDLGIS